MKRRLGIQEKRRRLMQAARGKFDPSSGGERTAQLAQFVERYAPMYPGVVEGIEAIFEAVRAEHPNATEEQIDYLAMARHLAMRRAEKGKP